VQTADAATMPTVSPSDSSDDLSYLEVEARVAALAESGDGTAARARLVGFLTQHPACAEAHNDLGVLAYEAGELPAAAAAIERAIALRPDCARYHRNRALVLLSQGELAAALAVLSRSLSLDPTDEETLKIITDLEIARRQRH
jgi:Flp pilus assembly protein TadD